MFQFATPHAFLLLLLYPLLIFIYILNQKRATSLRYSSISTLKKAPISIITTLRHIPLALRLLATLFIIIALARPQGVKEIEKEGINIYLVLDISPSMGISAPFRPAKLPTAKNVVRKFIDGRENDRVGLTVFSDDAFIQCPLTLNHNLLKNFLKNVEAREQGGTAIGLGIALSVDSIRNMDGSKVLILLTDGRNNAGEIDPITAARIAKTFNVKIYTIGFDEGYASELTQIADITSGQYYHATSVKDLDAIYEKINELEKVTIKETDYREYREYYLIFVVMAIILLFLETILSKTRFRRIP